MKTVARPRDWFFKTRKTSKKPSALACVKVALTELEARIFLKNIQSFKEPGLVRAAAKIARQLTRVKHLRSVGLLEVLKDVK